MKKFFRFTGVFLRSFPRVMLFELLFKLLLTAFGTPLLALLVRLTMNNTGINYLSAENIPQLMENPLSYGVILLILIVAAVFSVAELSALIACYAAYYSKKRLTAFGMLRYGIRTFIKAFRGTGVFSFLCFMLIVPLVQFTLSSGVFFAPVMPMLRSVFSSLSKFEYIVAYILLQSGVIFLLASRIYSLHFLVLTDNPFSECTKESRRLLAGRKLRTAVTLVLRSIMLTVFIYAVTFAVSFAVVFCIKGFSQPDEALSAALKILNYAWQILIAVSAVISAPILICSMTVSFFDDTEGLCRLTIPDRKTMKDLPRYVKAIAATVLAALGIFLNFSYLRELYRGNISINLGTLSTPQITAHRGFSHTAPENTVYAFEQAMASAADYIELDVQLTADSRLVVFHDTKLDRTTNGTGRLSDYTYEELSSLSCGEWFGREEYNDAKIMLLSEVLDLAQDDIMLNIEIKKQGNPEYTARLAAELLIEYELTDSCYITSFSYPALRAVKKVCPEIKTGVISNSAAAAVYSHLHYVDAVSLNHIFVNQNIISTAHKNGKKVFVWTVNSKEDIERMVSLGADNIITDRPDLAAETVYSYGKGEIVLDFLKKLFGT